MNIVVTGSTGFLGSHLMAHLRALGHDPYGVTRQAYDLRHQSHIDALFKHTGIPDLIFHLAANVGGIQFNSAYPGSIFYDNVIMNTQFIHAAAMHGVGKFVMVGTVCSYSQHAPIPMREHHLWTGYPELSNGAYGISKLMALTQLQAHKQQFGLNFTYPILSNLYGPGDHFDDAKSHVIPALIKKFDTRSRKVLVWGDGSPTRDFLYVEDAAEALGRFIEADYSEPINIAGGSEIGIRRLAELIAQLSGYKGKIEFDQDRPNGQLRRCYDISQARRVLDWQPKISLEAGLRRTIEWWRSKQLS